MLDENLPAFFLRPSTTGQKHHQSFYLSYHGSDPEPAYLLQHADPASPSPSHRNCYAAALFDAFNPEVLFGEVLARPQWTQPTLSQEELRRNNGIPPPPQPILPQEFTVQLYNPDQQVSVSVKEGKWGASSTYEFSMPETTFRTPSASTLDRGQSDPASLPVTPKINFSWRKESKLGKDFVCLMTGKSTDAHEKKKSRRDPDIAIALWRSMRELTIYEPNLSRIDLEDPKGLEVVLLLSAVVIKDLYFSNQSRLVETFNVDTATAGPSRRKLSGRTSVSPSVIPPTPNDLKRSSLPKLQTPGNPAPPPADPRAQWQLEAETAHLRAEQQAEARRAKATRERAAEAERLRLLKFVENEEKEARRKQAEIERETERLRKQYGVKPVPPQRQGGHTRQRQEGPYLQSGPARTEVGIVPPAREQRRMGSNGLYINNAASSSAVVMSGANGAGGSGVGLRPKPAAKKKSFWGLRGASEEGNGDGRRLAKKSSAMW